MASIYPKGGHLYISFYKDGKRVMKSLHLKDNRENRRIAKEIRLEKERELSLPNQVVKHSLTVSEAMNRFNRYKSDNSEKTKEIYESVFKHFKKYFGGSKKVTDLGDDEILEFKKYLQGHKSKITGEVLSQNTVSSYFRTLSAFFVFLIKHDLYNKRNPVPRLKSISKEIIVIPDEHFKIILAYLKGKSKEQYNVIAMLRLTGRRVNEVLSISWDMVDLDSKLIRITNRKANRDEFIPIHNKLLDLLKSMPKRKGRLFMYKNAASMKFWRRALVKLELPLYSLHSIRKTFATKLVFQDVPIFDASKILGHSNIKTTIDFYARYDVKKLNTQLDKVFEE